MSSRKGSKEHARPEPDKRQGQGSRTALMAYIAAAALWMVMIFSLSSVSNIKQPAGLGGVENIDKPEHLGLYFVLAAFIFMALRERGLLTVPKWMSTEGPRTAAFLAFIISTVYGITDEMHQNWVPDRSMDVVDLMMDAIGGLLAPLILMVILMRMGRGTGTDTENK